MKDAGTQTYDVVLVSNTAAGCQRKASLAVSPAPVGHKLTAAAADGCLRLLAAV